MEDNFTFDEVDEERFVRKQKLAYKEEVAKAKDFLEQMKSTYYDEIKLRPSVTLTEQKKAMEPPFSNDTTRTTTRLSSSSGVSLYIKQN